jgi:hypothetical protein
MGLGRPGHAEGERDERLGFVAVTTTTPYVWSPPAA